MKLKDYLKIHNLTQLEFAFMTKVCASSVHCWVEGTKTPSRRNQERIFKKTKGQVTLNDWKKVDKK